MDSIKNSRLLAEFREIDSYLTDSSDEESEAGGESGSFREAEFDNSILRMARALLSSAKSNPAEHIDEVGNRITLVPKIKLRLTRLDPASLSDNDPRIAKTVRCLTEMGVDLSIGKRGTPELSAIPEPFKVRNTITPTVRINLDLSLLIALVSDLTHSSLPSSIEEAHKRFVPPKRERKWKKTKVSHRAQSSSATSESTGDLLTDVDTENADLAKHSRALTNQLLQEMSKGLLQEIHDRLLSVSEHSVSLPCNVEFWTTPEAKERCLRIVSKIGGTGEQQRVHALFADDPKMMESYWDTSRFAAGFLPLTPVRLLPSNFAPSASLEIKDLATETNRDSFTLALEQTCRDILQAESRAQDAECSTDTTPSINAADVDMDFSDIKRAMPMKANARLTGHTVRSLMWGARLGWTTLTANRTSIKAILREMIAKSRTGTRIPQPTEEGLSAICSATIWLVDPRSLAEGMRDNIY